MGNTDHIEFNIKSEIVYPNYRIKKKSVGLYRFYCMYYDCSKLTAMIKSCMLSTSIIHVKF